MIDYYNFPLMPVCSICGERKIIFVNELDYDDWEKGKPIEEAMSYLNDYGKRMLTSGICPTCWKEIFSSFNSKISDDEWPEEE